MCSLINLERYHPKKAKQKVSLILLKALRINLTEIMQYHIARNVKKFKELLRISLFYYFFHFTHITLLASFKFDKYKSIVIRSIIILLRIRNNRKTLTYLV